MAEEIIFCGPQVVLEVAAGQGPQGPPGEFPEAPLDGKAYARQDGGWVELPITSPNGQWRLQVTNEGIVEAVEL